MYEGQIIKYTVGIMPLVRVGWTTRISEVKYPTMFMDEQLSGPYQVWKHRHTFKEVAGGVEMTDDLEYVVPLGFLGTIANTLYVGREVGNIFAYRFKVLETYFSKKA